MVETASIEERLDAIEVHDVDTHVSEPPDLWTSRMPSKWGDETPHVEVGPDGRRAWFSGGERIMGAAGAADEHPLLDTDTWAGATDPHARLRWMDKHGIRSQVLYPNLVGFFGAMFATRDPAFGIDVYRAYNDFQTDFSSVAPDRLIPLANLPFWDLDASVAELERCHGMGHKGLNFGFRFEQIGLPRLRDMHWDPILRRAEEMGWSVNFHVGFSGNPADDPALQFDVDHSDFDRVKFAAALFAGNMQCIAELIMSGLCKRYPTLKFVSVESGIGFIPYLIEALDWQFVNQNLHRTHPDWLRPSEYFRRQIYGCFWFEQDVARLADLYPDNFMFESDYPHPTSLTPADDLEFVLGPRETIIANLATLPDDLLRKVVHDNAARVYGLD